MTLTLSGLSKVFGAHTAVHPLDLTVPEGSFFALLGASGCGKTTTLRMIAGLEEPTAGTVELGGEDITALPAHRRPVNTVFQSYALFPHLDVRDNVAFGPRSRGVPTSRARRLAEETLELVQLGPCARRRPWQLSGGQQQRVALARALVNQPRVLLLDEPLGALDLRLRRRMQRELKRVQAEVGITFVHVTHDQEEAMAMADAVAVLRAGRVEQRGDPAELYENPRSAFVAGFLGSSNLLPAQVAEVGEGELRLAVPGAPARLRLPARRCAAEGVGAGDRVLMGVRPEKISLLAAAERDGTGGHAADEPSGPLPRPVDDASGGPAAGPPAAGADDLIPEAAEERHNVLDGVLTDVGYLGVSLQYTVRPTAPTDPDAPAGPDASTDPDALARAASAEAAPVGASPSEVGTAGVDITVYAQNLGRNPQLVPGAAVRLRWLPRHTFAFADTADTSNAADTPGALDASADEETSP